MQALRYHKRLQLYMIFAGVVPVLLLSVGVLVYLHQTTEDTEAQKVGQNVRSIALQVEAEIDRCRKITDSLAASKELRDYLRGTEPDAASVYSQLFLLLRGMQAGAGLQVISVSGESLFSAGRTTYPSGYRYNTNWGEFRQAQAAQESVVISADRVEAGRYGPVLIVCKAMRQDGEILGYILMAMYRPALEGALASYDTRGLRITDAHHYVFFTTAADGREGFVPEITGTSRFRDPLGAWAHFGTEDSGTRLYYYQAEKYGIMAVQEQATNWDHFYLLRRIIFGFDAMILLLSLLFLVPRARRLLEEIRQREETLRMAQIKGLEEQIKPHFIYNTLDLIKWMAKRGDQESVARIAVALGRLLRRVLGRSAFVQVREEAEILEAYLIIQQKRFSGRVQVTVQIPEALYDCYLPKLILQPVLENALKHGLKDVQEEGRIEIIGRQEAAYMVFTIRDNGCGIDIREVQRQLEGGAEATGEHVGLRNVHLRAKLNGDASCGVSVTSVSPHGTQVAIRLVAWKEMPKL
ncbi:hypothetical protein TAMA11512_08180 [Selenomonas sp. TAMA-11512]|uniref:histidine kinase n=1 Tax=Selenomonas sp. TAMA-11512 TaxID=3095337 RepID=UPI003093ADC5|nr:hypothetical protein TAMA11512_08180 [Selenomonas sp. TAMA-11512]